MDTKKHFPEVKDGPVPLPQDAHEPLISLIQSQQKLHQLLSNLRRCELKPSAVSALICRVSLIPFPDSCGVRGHCLPPLTG